MYKDNKRVRDDWIGKNMQYLIGRTGLFKHYQGESFRPWSGQGYRLPARYTNLQIDGESGRPCAHLTTKCEKPVDIDQYSWVDRLETHLQVKYTFKILIILCTPFTGENLEFFALVCQKLVRPLEGATSILQYPNTRMQIIYKLN